MFYLGEIQGSLGTAARVSRDGRDQGLALIHSTALIQSFFAAQKPVQKSKNRLKEIAEAVASGRMQTARGSVSGQVYGLVLKAIEQERRQHEVKDLKRQLEEVRDLYEHQKSQARGIGGSWWTS